MRKIPSRTMGRGFPLEVSLSVSALAMTTGMNGILRRFCLAVNESFSVCVYFGKGQERSEAQRRSFGFWAHKQMGHKLKFPLSPVGFMSSYSHSKITFCVLVDKPTSNEIYQFFLYAVQLEPNFPKIGAKCNYFFTFL